MGARTEAQEDCTHVSLWRVLLQKNVVFLLDVVETRAVLHQGRIVVTAPTVGTVICALCTYLLYIGEKMLGLVVFNRKLACELCELWDLQHKVPPKLRVA